MSIKLRGGVFGRNPTFNDVDVTGSLTAESSTFNVGMSVNGNIAMASGSGIDFSATANSPNGTMSSELLSDYEEGTFTPVLADAQTGGNTASTANTKGIYTKVGRQVTCKIEFVNINTGGMTGANAIWLRNLPFAVSEGCTGVTRLDDWDFDSTGWVVFEALGSDNTTGRFFNVKDNTSDSILTVGDINSGNADCSLHLTYFV